MPPTPRAHLPRPAAGWPGPSQPPRAASEPCPRAGCSAACPCWPRAGAAPHPSLPSARENQAGVSSMTRSQATPGRASVSSLRGGQGWPARQAQCPPPGRVYLISRLESASEGRLFFLAPGCGFPARSFFPGCLPGLTAKASAPAAAPVTARHGRSQERQPGQWGAQSGACLPGDPPATSTVSP